MSTSPLKLAVALAVGNVADGGGPFGAVVVLPNGRAVTGANRVTSSCDPTAHAEVTAIRNAAAVLGSHDLSGSVLYTSCQPCPMCLTAALWARIDKVVYSASSADAAAAGFDDAEFYQQVSAAAPTMLELVHEPTSHPSPTAPFEAWAAYEERTDY